MSNEPRHRYKPELLGRARENRREAVFPEHLLWQHLRNRQLDGLKFRRKAPLAPYIADFVCHEAKLIVELDGRSHEDRQAYDQRRDQKLVREGYRVLRVLNDDVLRDIRAVLRTILRDCGRNSD